jgi:hypothetical protein
MKILRRKTNASVLAVALVTSAVLMVGLASYYSLIQSQNNSVTRSQTWNTAIPAAEAGIEDALSHLNTIGDASRATNGYVLNGNMFVVSRQLGSFRYVVGIETSNQPAIYSTGYVHTPKGNAEVSRIIKVQTTRFASGMRGLVAINGLTMNGTTSADSFDSADPNYSTGGAYDPAKHKDGSFVGSVTGNIDTGGGTVYGYMSTGPNGAASGNAGTFAWFNAGNNGIQPGHYQKDMNVYYPPVAAPFSGGATTPTGATFVTTNYTYGNLTIVTNVPPNPLLVGTVTTNSSRITTTSYPTGQSAITTNTTFTSSKTFPAAGTYLGSVVTRVVTSGPSSKRGTWYDYQAITGYTYTGYTYSYLLNTTNYTTSSDTYAYVLGNNAYQLSSLSISGSAGPSSTMLVTGNAILYVTGDISLQGNAQIVIAPGASLRLYVGGNANFAGNGILNQNGDTTTFSYYGLPTNTSVALSGNAAFTGTFYAPQADFALNGSGNSDYDLVGASVTKTVSMHGHFHFHYDEKLGRLSGPVRYRTASWDEL